MDFNILDDATLWVGLSFVLFVLLVIKPLTSIFSQNIDAQIADSILELFNTRGIICVEFFIKCKSQSIS